MPLAEASKAETAPPQDEQGLGRSWNEQAQRMMALDGLKTATAAQAESETDMR